MRVVACGAPGGGVVKGGVGHGGGCAGKCRAAVGFGAWTGDHRLHCYRWVAGGVFKVLGIGPAEGKVSGPTGPGRSREGQGCRVGFLCVRPLRRVFRRVFGPLAS